MKLAALALLAACSSSSAPAPKSPEAPPRPAFKPTAFTVQVSGAGRPVIFIPGLASPGAVWDGAVAHLGGRVQAHVLTLAGFAGVAPVKGPFLQQVHDQIVQYIEANHLEHPVVVGHSLGGVMSLWLAETDPAVGAIVDVDGLPFLAAAMDPTATADKAKQMGAGMQQQLLAAPHDQFVGFMHQFIGAMVVNADALKMLDDAADKSDQETVANAFAELLGMDLRPDLPKITASVTIVAAGEGRDSRDKLEAAWHAQVDPIPHHELAIVDGAKHFVMLDKPDAFYALLDKAVSAK
ncbi:MAG: alpha/beta hydrolase [Deltaproteobacteria bacterium]|nr:alpha/beta hydrolase [Deltaproteobacteria bacterium]